MLSNGTFSGQPASSRVKQSWTFHLCGSKCLTGLVPDFSASIKMYFHITTSTCVGIINRHAPTGLSWLRLWAKKVHTSSYQSLTQRCSVMGPVDEASGDQSVCLDFPGRASNTGCLQVFFSDLLTTFFGFFFFFLIINAICVAYRKC